MNPQLFSAVISAGLVALGFVQRAFVTLRNDNEEEAERLLEESRGRYGDARQEWDDAPGPQG